MTQPNDTFEPGSTFKIVTGAAGLEEGLVTTDSMFNCSGFKVVGGRQIRCWRHPRAHGALNFVAGFEHSCNPVFMDIEPVFNEEELAMDGVGQVAAPLLTGQSLRDAGNILDTLGLETEVFGAGNMIINQFPIAGEVINQGARVIVYLGEGGLACHSL